MSEVNKARERNKRLAAKRGIEKSRSSTANRLKDVLQAPETEYGERLNLTLNAEQDHKIRRLGFEHRLSLVEVVRQMIDAFPEDQIKRD